MLAVIRYVLLTSVRDNVLFAVLALTIGASAIAFYFGSVALFEQRETATVYMAGSVRTLLVLGLTVFMAFHVQRLMDTREIEAILSKTLSRWQFILAYWMGFAALGLVLMVPAATLVVFLAAASLSAFLWAAAIAFELAILAAFVLFAGLTFERAIPTLSAVLGFYVLGRLTAFFLGIAGFRAQFGVLGTSADFLEYISLLLPRFDLMARSDWLVNGVSMDHVLILLFIQAIIYIPVLLAAAYVDMAKKAF